VQDRLRLEELTKTLKQAVGMRDAFLAMASHELKTPLTALKLQAQHWENRLSRHREGTVNVQNCRTFGHRVLKQADKLNRLVEDMLDISRIAANRFCIARRPGDLARMVCEAAEPYGVQFKDAGSTLTQRLQPGIIGLWDSDRLDQVVANLLSNALRYAPGKNVHITLKAKGQNAILSVEDEGSGVPEAIRKRLFESFSSSDDAGTMGGLGLGLHICRRIVQLHGGKMAYQPLAGAGARFVVNLPIQNEAAQPPGGQPPAT
jgi:signal transduction histidine kinase